MSKWLPSFVARDATTSLPFIGICRHAFGPLPPGQAAAQGCARCCRCVHGSCAAGSTV
jgi:hypothetical protein